MVAARTILAERVGFELRQNRDFAAIRHFINKPQQISGLHAFCGVCTNLLSVPYTIDFDRKRYHWYHLPQGDLNASTSMSNQLKRFYLEILHREATRFIFRSLGGHISRDNAKRVATSAS